MNGTLTNMDELTTEGEIPDPATNGPSIEEQYRRNLRIFPPKLYYFVTSYAVLLVVGVIGNILLIIAVLRKRHMRTIRNVFVINLAVSDLLICLITMPLTLMETVTVYWALGNKAFLCKLTGLLQGTSVFGSTLSITAIAIDRYRAIIHPSSPALTASGATTSLIMIWVLSIGVSLPNYIWRQIDTHQVDLPPLSNISFCFENWPVEKGRFYYSTIIIILQFIIPILTITFAYWNICSKVQNRMRFRSGMKAQSSAARNRFKMSSTTKLLLSITVTYCISWLPLNSYNVIVDLDDPFGDNAELNRIIYAICHLIAMSSACSNPFFYGWHNVNYRKEFQEIFGSMKICPKEADLENVESQRIAHEAINLQIMKSKKEEKDVEGMASCITASKQGGLNALQEHSAQTANENLNEIVNI